VNQLPIINRLIKASLLTFDLVESLEENKLNLKLGNLPSNTFGEQLSCIIGARESYIRAIEHEGWKGYSCSLKNCNSKSEVLDSLKHTVKLMRNILPRFDYNEVQFNLLIDLLEHETMHHGQLIRYIYANKLQFPISWNNRYTV
jgi:hypothetical protein